MNGIAVSELITSLVMLGISIVFLVRWWKMTTDIKEIKRLLMQQKSEIKKTVSATVEPKSVSASLLEEIEPFKKKMKAGQCIVFVKTTSRMEIWDKSDWDEVVEKGRGDMFELIYCN